MDLLFMNVDLLGKFFFCTWVILTVTCLAVKFLTRDFFEIKWIFHEKDKENKFDGV